MPLQKLKYWPRRCFRCRRWFLAWASTYRELWSRHHHYYCSRDCAYWFLQQAARIRGISVPQLLAERGETLEHWEQGWRAE